MAGQDGASSIQACALRLSRLAADGTTPAGATNGIVTTGIIKLSAKAVFESGVELTLIDGCGRVATSYKDGDKLKRYDGTLEIATHDAEAAELLTAGSLITSGGSSIGYSTPAVGAASALGACVELWSKALVGNSSPVGVTFTDGVTSTNTALTSATAAFTSADVGRTVTGAGIPGGTTISSVTNGTTVVLSAATTATATGVSITIGRPGAYFRHVFPKFANANLSDFDLSNTVKTLTFTGSMFENSNIGNGPLNDFPSTMAGNRLYSWFRDAAVPATSFTYTTTPAQT